ncbi:Ig-like domain-containing protein [Oscillospiraceae bacterium LTW-04]|nr:PF13754 domain-containing protein [Oscillospiraceae bacterium MB24-C1]
MITAVRGSADGHELVLTPTGNGWRATLPPDLADGQYVMTLSAADEAGNIVDYRGVLYLCAGICNLSMRQEAPAFLLLPDNLEIERIPERWQIRFVRHWRF